jgi:hypothetical protein
MDSVIGAGVDLFVSITLIVVGFDPVRRVHKRSAWLFMAAGGLNLVSSCFSRAMEMTSEPYLAWASHSIVREFLVGVLVVAALVSLARRLDKMHGPTRF